MAAPATTRTPHDRPQAVEPDVGEVESADLPEVADEAARPRSQRTVLRTVRAVLNRNELVTGNPPPAVIAVVSAVPGEGVTTVSRALAEVLSLDLGVSVCWVDLGRARKPRPDDAPGITDVLSGQVSLDDVLAHAPDEAGPSLIGMGREVHRSEGASLLRSPELMSVLGSIAQNFEHLVLDCAPVLSNGDGLPVIRRADAYLLVTRYGSTTSAQVHATTAELDEIPSIGAILNGYSSRTPSRVRRMLGM